MKNSWTPVVVILVLVTWLGFASTSNKKIEPKDNRSFGALTVRGPSTGAVKIHPELKRAYTNIILVDELDAFGKNRFQRRANFANCSKDDCCCLVGSDAKCTAKSDCPTLGGKCVDDSKCKTGARPEEAP